MSEDKVIVDFEKYHNQMNELTFLRDYAIKLYCGDITLEEFKKQMEKLNKKYWWWR